MLRDAPDDFLLFFIQFRPLPERTSFASGARRFLSFVDSVVHYGFLIYGSVFSSCNLHYGLAETTGFTSRASTFRSLFNGEQMFRIRASYADEFLNRAPPSSRAREFFGELRKNVTSRPASRVFAKELVASCAGWFARKCP